MWPSRQRHASERNPFAPTCPWLSRRGSFAIEGWKPCRVRRTPAGIPLGEAGVSSETADAQLEFELL
jgi:hypothetical protein